MTATFAAALVLLALFVAFWGIGLSVWGSDVVVAYLLVFAPIGSLLIVVATLLFACAKYGRFSEKYGDDPSGVKPAVRFIGGIFLYGIGSGVLGLALIPAVVCLFLSQCEGIEVLGVAITGPLGFVAGTWFFVASSLSDSRAR